MKSVALEGPKLPAWAKFLGFPFLPFDSKLVHSESCLHETCQDRIVGEKLRLLRYSYVLGRNSSEMASSAFALIIGATTF